jgi:spermidine synthase
MPQTATENSCPASESLPFSRALRVLPTFFFFSGASSLIFETIFTRLLTYTFGNTSHAVSTVLAAFLGGLALGAFLIGRWADRRSPSLRIYGALELMVAVYCLFLPQLFALLTRVYVGVCQDLHLGSAGLTVVRLLLAGIVIMIPTLLMGGTLPVLARCVAAGGSGFETDLDRLYAWNTLGAALGTLASTYFFMPILGVRATIVLACAVNTAIFLGIILLASRTSLSVGMTKESHPPNRDFVLAEVPAAPLLVGALLVGAISLAYEVIWTHVLAFLIGNTVYAFGVMLFTFLCGLGWGAHVVSRRLRAPFSWGQWLAASQLLLGLVIFLTVPLWSRVPDLFAHGFGKALELDLMAIALLVAIRMTYAGWRIYGRARGAAFPWARGAELVVGVALLLALLGLNTSFLLKYETAYFIAGELLRFFSAFYLLVIPSLLLGMSFPLLLNLATHTAQEVGSSVGGIYAANTVGTVLGSLLTGFVLLPRLGSHAVLKGAAAANLLLGLAFFLWLAPQKMGRKLALAGITILLGAFFILRPSGWDENRMTRGTYVYFTRGWSVDRVLYMKEDTQGGLTSVVQSGSTRVMLTNGKFQGNNTGEVGAQIRFASIPMLFTRNFDRALVIGLGTGQTLRAVARFPFRKIDVVELAPHIVEAARLWFEDVNDLTFDRDPRVRLRIEDGRNFLLLSRESYDLITIEISSIWVSGEADLYNKEFYELCRRRLTRQGVLQQWMQVHHMRPQDFLVMLNTAAHVFPHAAFFLGPEQGLLIASVSPLEIDYAQIERFDADPGIRRELDHLGVPSIASLLGELMLYGDSFHRCVALLPRLGGLPADFVSTDFRPYLEYQTPKGNSVPYDTSELNIRIMERFRPELLPPDLPIRNLRSDDDKNLLMGFVAEGRGNLAAALEYLRRVQGAGKARAWEQIGRIKSSVPGREPH